MTFDLVVTISMHFFSFISGAKQTEMLEINRRSEILHLRSVCPPSGGGGGGYSDFSIFFIRTLARAIF